MRISDWSSDVCSSDLRLGRHAADVDAGAADGAVADQRDLGAFLGSRDGGGEPGRSRADHGEVVPAVGIVAGTAAIQHVRRSEERRVGKECVSTCRTRWSPYHYKKKTSTQRA